MEGLGLVLGARRLEVRGLRAPIVGIGAIGAGSFVESGGGGGVGVCFFPTLNH